MLVPDIRPATLSPHLHSRFRVKGAQGDVVELLLARVEPGASSGSFEQFSLYFEGPVVPSLSQGTFTFEHDVLGALDIFIVPIRQDQRTRTYEAVFSRRLEAVEVLPGTPREDNHEPA